MSRNGIILLVLLCAVAAGIIVLSKKRSAGGADTVQTTTPTEAPVATTPTPVEPRPGVPAGREPVTQPAPGPNTPATTVDAGVGRTTVAARNATTPAPGTQRPATPLPNINLANTNELPLVKPLPEMEKDYASATNRDTRLDLMMDIAETPSADAVRTLTRLFELETDPDLKVDLLDSLLGIEGFKEEKLIMLTMGARQGLPAEVRQSAIDGLIDLEDPRVVPILNGLLNDPDPEIREGAQDALEMIQAQPAPTVKLIK